MRATPSAHRARAPTRAGGADAGELAHDAGVLCMRFVAALRCPVTPNHATGDDLVAPGDETGVGHAMEERVQRAGRDAVAVVGELFGQLRAMNARLTGVMQHV